MSKPIIEVRNISKSYTIGEQVSFNSLREEIMQTIAAPFRRKTDKSSDDNIIWALNDVSFEVQEGEVLGIIGRNGAGKSTLLKILSRITEPSSGKITMRGRVASLLEVGTGFHPELTGRENILLNGALLGMSRQEIKSKFDEIVAFAEIEKFIDTPVKRYSSGMYVRLAFAVAAHLEPEILIVDEVLAVGDAQFQKKCLGKMGSISKEGRTVLFVSHNMGVISKLCEKSILLHRGKVIDISNTSNVVKQYNDLYKQIDNNNECLFTSEYVDIDDITINGRNSQEIIIPSGLRSMEVKITCHFHYQAVMYPELKLFDFLGNCLFYYTPRLDSVQSSVGKGKVTFDINLNLPYVTKGEYSLGLYIAKGDPFEKNVIEYNRCRTIVFDGEPLHGGWIVQYDKGNGAVLLERKAS